MKITAVTPVILGYRKSDPPMSRSFALVRIDTDAGITGWGEASTNWGHSYPTVFAAAVSDVCASALIGQEPRSVRARLADLHTRMDGYLGWEGLTSQTIGAIEMALWDILGRSVNAPVWQLLGGGGGAIDLYGTGTTMFEASAGWHAAYFDQAITAGFGAVKVRLGRTREADVDVVREVRRHVGDGVRIGVDSYWFHDARSALALAEDLAELGVFFFEEPLPQYRTAELAWLAERSPVPIAVGERVFSARQYAELARTRAAGVFQPDASICGGLLECLDIAALAAREGIPVYPHVGGPTAIGLSANLQWASAAGVPLLEYDIDPHQPLVDDLAPSLSLAAISGGMLAPPTGPGLGVEVPDDIAERYPYQPGETYTDVFPQHERGTGAPA
ncbi:L-alanine-DL-glutamate epimerase-like enolase superfamily enzyme [Microbacteriaceae bacterium SG_E_30_P1]|uniref:L-alanine-DL-glutamate epimerase-like enolase superfamily enzyme n=1 Tax=Antiquaquibacter oligotrophicus TaxID=2880260 RepID=A0ABT6KNK1_9MICO|nr:mandelate racemase/muconate lactonizing enzyme family protein [Antiquaquibacter oligotrophicus]MDH6181582.1 L-alanine-DL-glutamate epimerase-like enolase superfamily enzyme [Antiquaquibacter oligotrophicus]UDF12732.1 mandelate racemase/muconate lactonizing enzyme family protein [Antiquaquibacter oligotrophicus]